MIQQIKLSLWWKFAIKKNEMSHKLNLSYIRDMYGKELNLQDASMLVVRQRDLAHELDMGAPAMSIPSLLIKKSKICLIQELLRYIRI